VTSVPDSDTWCQNFYQFVEPGTPAVTFHNYDVLLSRDAYVIYRSPDNRIYYGTVSANNKWNGPGATTMRRVGDTIINPEPGWWILRVCTDNLNQFVQEGQQGEPIYLHQPPKPDMQASMTSERVSVGRLRYTINMTNTSDTSSTPGAAQAITLTSQADPPMDDVRLVSCSVTGSLTGTCDYDTDTDTFTVVFDGLLAAGDSSSVTFTAIFPFGTSGEITGSVSVAYEDMLGNRYAPATATNRNSLP
jgi:hypothetical protein